ncbi:hypothetical protein [Lichenicola sp.]|uniref:hypothetical protein n=1 Tax=Lichenicola sp. TaxID=2804529 RepID=UPI003B00325D
MTVPAATPAPAAGPAPVAAAAPQTGGIVLHPQTGEAVDNPAGAVALTNDPSAPADTPLCGVAARETNAIGQAVLSRQYASAGICSSFACYDPATATYIGSDGYRHVCR